MSIHATHRNRAKSVRRGLQAVFLATILAAFGAVLPASAASSTPTPLLAYYSIGYDTGGSWNSHWPDSPLLGRYTSDDAAVMREHIHLAQQVGIDGFIVSWRNSPKLNHRLEQLIEIADGQNFKLAIAYQAVDGQNVALPAAKVAADLTYFQRHYTSHAAFTLFGKPGIIWSGTWAYSPQDIAQVAATKPKQLLLLASARTVDEYQALAANVDGNAYYWPSADPAASNYAQTLQDMATAVHAHRGLWIAPAAAGYSSQVGGDSPVDRAGGATLRQELTAARAANPDAIGLISWNVFKDNTQIEPGAKEGKTALNVVADVEDGSHIDVIDFDSSDPGNTRMQPGNFATLGGALLLVLASLGMIIVRNLRGK
jgi:hypothetical protein